MKGGVPTVVTTPVHEMVSEATVSLAWAPRSPHMLMVGTGYKWMRIYDLRDINNPKAVVAHTKNVFGLCFDPNNDSRIATFSDDGTIKVWDTRMLVKRTSQEAALWFSAGKGLSQIGWCPTRSGVLGSITEGSSTISLWDTNTGKVSDEGQQEGKPIKMKRCQTYSNPDGEPIVSFDWHRRSENRVLFTTPSGSIQDVTLRRPMAVSWGRRGNLAFSCEKELFAGEISASSSHSGAGPIFDIAERMHRRAVSKYALDLDVNIRIVEEAGEESLTLLWKWVKDLRERWNPKASGSEKPAGTPKWCGVLHLLCMHGQVQPGEWLGEIESSTRYLSEPSQRADLPGVVIYDSSWRVSARSLCGVCHSGGEEMELRLLELQESKRYTEAAMLALFHSGLGRAVQALKAGPAEMSILAMAMAGFAPAESGGESIWSDTCATVPEALQDEYLLASFRFLGAAATGGDYDNIVEDSLLALDDRTSFALKYLDDVKLEAWVEATAKKCINGGDLQGMRLVGLSPAGCELLQNYVDVTGDVQSAALVTLHAIPVDIQDSSGRAAIWVETYRELLDSWRMWHHRARLDVAYATLSGTQSKAQAQTYARCFYCKGPLCAALMKDTSSSRRQGSMFGKSAGAARDKKRTMVCPNATCGKELPKCSVCLLPLEFHAGKKAEQEGSNQVMTPVASKSTVTSSAGPSGGFDMWFTWCQTCMHGGHTDCLTSWSSKHSCCAVPGCDCRCGTLDLLSVTEVAGRH